MQKYGPFWWFLSLIGFIIGTRTYVLFGKSHPELLIPMLLAGFFGFPFLFRSLWQTAQRFGLVAKVYSIPFVWTMRTWASKPLWGHKRLQVIFNITLCAFFAGHLLWYHEVFSPVPRADRGVINTAVRAHFQRSGEAYVPVKRSDRIRPAAEELRYLPYPRIYTEITSPDIEYRLSSSVTAKNDASSFGRVAFRRLNCFHRRQNDRPDCELSIRLPIYWRVGPARDPRYLVDDPAKKSLSMSAALKASLSGLKLTFSNEVGYLHIRGRIAKSTDTTQISDLVRTDLLASGPPLSRETLARGIEPETLDRLLSHRGKLRLQITTDNDAFTKQVGLYCSRIHMDREACINDPAMKISVATCGKSQDLSQHHCTSVHQYLLSSTSYSIFRAVSSTESNKLDIHDGDVAFFYPMNLVEDRSFLILFARSHGREVAATSREQAYLLSLEKKITRDYATILDFSDAGGNAHDAKEIENALIRQPQLYPYYRDREYWGPIFEEALKEQLSALGFP
ncbi:MAG: hypothetical protein AAF982_00860 [Pseudomonadota bacterium]